MKLFSIPHNFFQTLVCGWNMSGSNQDVEGEELLDFEVQSPDKINVGSPENAACGGGPATKVSREHVDGVKVEADDHLEEGEVNSIRSSVNLEDGELSEEDFSGEAGLRVSVPTKECQRSWIEGFGVNKGVPTNVCRHFKAGRICMWGQVELLYNSMISVRIFSRRTVVSCTQRSFQSGETILCSKLQVQSRLW